MRVNPAIRSSACHTFSAKYPYGYIPESGITEISLFPIDKHSIFVVARERQASEKVNLGK
jgi:hypothetical protein